MQMKKGGKGVYKGGSHGGKICGGDQGKAWSPKNPNHMTSNHATRTSNKGSAYYHGQHNSIRDPNRPHDMKDYG